MLNVESLPVNQEVTTAKGPFCYVCLVRNVPPLKSTHYEMMAGPALMMIGVCDEHAEEIRFEMKREETGR